jgi:serine/threonine-protein kinase
MRRPDAFEELPPYREAIARGDWERARKLLEELAGPEGLPPAESLALAEVHRLRGNAAQAVPILERVARGGDSAAAVEALVELALLRLETGAERRDAIESIVERAAALAGEDGRLQGLIAHARGRILRKHGEMERAVEQLEAAKRHLQSARADEWLGKVLDALAMLYEHRGDRERALSHYALSLAKKAQWRDLYGVAITLGNLGRFHLRAREPELAHSCFLDDLRISEAIGDLRAQVVVKINIGQALTELGRVPEAQQVLEEALALARNQGWRQEEAYALKDLGRAAARAGDSARAFALLGSALELVPDGAPAYPRGEALLAQAEVHFDLGEWGRARAAFEAAREIFAALKARREEGLAVHGLARVAEKLGEWNSCVYFLERGMELLTTAGPMPVADAILEETFHRVHIAIQDRALPRSIGPYRVLSRLGSGAFGEVYRAFDERNEAERTDVALKVLRLEGIQDPSERENRIARFRREYRVLKEIGHPNVVRILEFGEDPMPYLVEEYLAGGDLRAAMGVGKLMPLERALPLMEGILGGLEAIHGRGIVHRDLKPGNVLLRSESEPVLADFGLARVLERTVLTQQSMIMGTLPYMAPEQVRGERVDRRADIYAFGALFYEALSGVLPREAKSLGEAQRNLDSGPPRDLAALRPALPARVSCMVMRCLESDPERRFPSAAAALAEIEG